MSKQIFKKLFIFTACRTCWFVGCRMFNWMSHTLNIIKSILTLMITIASHLLFFHFSYTHYSYLIFFISLFFKRQFTCKKFILLNGYEKNILNSVLSVLYSSFFSTSLNIIKWTIIATKILLRVREKKHEWRPQKFWMRFFFA